MTGSLPPGVVENCPCRAFVPAQLNLLVGASTGWCLSVSAKATAHTKRMPAQPNLPYSYIWCPLLSLNTRWQTRILYTPAQSFLSTSARQPKLSLGLEACKPKSVFTHPGICQPNYVFFSISASKTQSRILPSRHANRICHIISLNNTISAREGSTKRGTSPRPSAPRQARTSQRRSSAAATAGSGGGPGGVGGVGGGLTAGGDAARDTSSRRGSGGSSSVRLSSRKR